MPCALSPCFSSSNPLNSPLHRRFTPTQLHSVIADVDSYQSFLPFTSASRVLSAAHFSHPDGRREPQAAAGKGWLQGTEGDRWQMDAELRIGAMGFDEGYVSLVEMEVGKWVKVRFSLPSLALFAVLTDLFHLQATAKDASMFRHLSTLWSFTPLFPSTAATPQTKVDLNLAYQFTSPLHAAALSAVWDKVSALMVQKFEERVEVVHGRR